MLVFFVLAETLINFLREPFKGPQALIDASNAEFTYSEKTWADWHDTNVSSPFYMPEWIRENDVALNEIPMTTIMKEVRHD